MHQELEELLALQALGALDDEDRARLERHLDEGCLECREKLSGLERTVSMLAFAAPPKTPPAALRDRLSTVPEGGRESAPRAPVPSEPVPFPTRGESDRERTGFGPVLAVALLGAAAAVAIVFLGWSLLSAQSRLDSAIRELADLRETNQSQQQELERQERVLGAMRDPEMRLTRLSAPGDTPEPAIDVFWQPSGKKGVLVARNLPRVAPDRAYELWLIAGSAPVPAVTFNTDAHGNAVVEIGELPADGSPQKFAITVEPAGGSPAPTTPIVFVGDYGA